MANHVKAVKYQATIDKQVKALQQEVNTHQTQELNVLKQQNTEQQKQIQDLQSQVQARAAEKAQNAVLASAVHTVSSFVAPNAYAASQGVGSAGGSHEAWMTSAGIAQSDWSYVDYIVSHESGWNPYAVNASSGACSLMQSLPCSKISGDWRNPVNALAWGNSYVSRYGGWAGAYNFWLSHHWY